MKQRIARAERALQQQRRACPTCAGWPAARVVYDTDVHDPGGDIVLPPEIPERCPRCGWEPITIRVRYVDD